MCALVQQTKPLSKITGAPSRSYTWLSKGPEVKKEIGVEIGPRPNAGAAKPDQLK